jgi:hypothetical protein
MAVKIYESSSVISIYDSFDESKYSYVSVSLKYYNALSTGAAHGVKYTVNGNKYTGSEVRSFIF